MPAVAFDEGVVTITDADPQVDAYRLRTREVRSSELDIEPIDAGPLAPAVVNGEAVDITDVPYGTKVFAFAFDLVQFECGGVMISPRYMLTAAHCTEFPGVGGVYRDVDYLSVIHGVSDWTTFGDDPFTHLEFSDRIWRHPDYSRTTFANDIAVVRLESPIPGAGIGVSLWEGDVPDGAAAYVSGWGLTETFGVQTSLTLQGAEIAIDGSCAFWSELDGWDDEMYLCGTAEPGAFCQGDSGGPLAVERAGVPMLVGLVSFNSTFGCAQGPDIADVYTRVSSYIDWIETHTGPLWLTDEIVDPAELLAGHELSDLGPGETHLLSIAPVVDGVAGPASHLSFTVDWPIVLGPDQTGVDCREPQQHPLADVPESSFAFGSVGCLYQLGITTGTTPTTFSPKDRVIRGHMALFVARFYETVTGQVCVGTHPFLDVAPGAVGDAVGCLAALGITNGTSPITFSPDDFVTRAQMAAFIARLYEVVMGERCASVPGFIDVAATSFAFGPVGCLVDLEITTGTSAFTFSPERDVTREELAAFLERLYLALTS